MAQEDTGSTSDKSAATTKAEASDTGSTASSSDVEKTGATTTKDLLRSMPSLGSFQSSGNLGSSASAMSDSPAIHGIKGLTLVLLNGHRMAGAGVYNTSPDPSSIPPSAIERIEVSDQGASSIYGADAVVGVVNFVLKKDFDGARTSVKHGMGDGYQTWSFSQLLGTSWDSGSLMVAYDHASNTHLASYKRDYVTDNQTKHGWGDNRSTLCSPANITLDDVVYGLSDDGSVSTEENKCEVNKYTDLYPSMMHDQGMVSVVQYLNPSVEVHANVLYSHRSMSSSVGPMADMLSNAGLAVTVPSTSPYYIQIGDSTDDESVTYNPINDVGVLHNTIYMNTVSATAGTQVRLSDKWMGLLETTYGVEDDVANIPGINQTYVTEAAEDGTLNPYGVGDENSDDVKSAVADYYSRYTARQTMNSGDLKITGSLYDLPAGAIELTAGATVKVDSYAAYTYSGPKYDNDLLSSDAQDSETVSTADHRTSYAFYAQVAIPLINETNRLPLVEGLSVTASVRRDSYDDVGSSVNPVVSVNWSPVKSFWLHGGYNTAFRPPSFTDMGSSINSRVYRYADQTGSSDTSAYALVVTGGNDGLKSETAVNWWVSANWDPEFIPGLSLGMRYFNTDYQNVISDAGNNVFTDTSSVYSNYRIYNPTYEEAESWISGYRHDGVFDLTEKLPTAIYDLTKHNLYEEWFDGVDFNAHYSFKNQLGNFGVGLSGTYMLDFTKEFLLTHETEDFINSNNAVALMGRWSFTWAQGPYNAAFFVNYTGPYTSSAVTTNAHVHSYTTADFHFGWNLPVWHGASVSLDVNNFLDTDPPHYYDGSATYAVTRGYDPSMASALGRVIQIGVTKDW